VPGFDGLALLPHPTKTMVDETTAKAIKIDLVI
jgi:hypothetical protein